MPDPSTPSVGAVLDELERRAQIAAEEMPYTVGAILPPATALALIEVARRVTNLRHASGGDACWLPKDVAAEECPVCALGRLTEGRAE